MTAQGAGGASVREFDYRIRWRNRFALPGHHKSSRLGAGFEYSATAPLLDYPDPRRLDVRRSVCDPFSQLFVRVYNQQSLAPVYALVDLSASMGFQGVGSKLAILTEFLSILAFSAGRTGDPFGLLACADRVLPQLVLPATRNSEAVRAVLHRLSGFTPGGGAEGLIEPAPLIGHRRTLTFMISDFHFPIDFTRRMLRAYARHDIVPVVIWDSAEYRNAPAFGIARIRDSETGAERYALLRRTLRQRLRESFDRRRETLKKVFLEFGHKPYFLLDKIDCDDLNRFFIER